MAQVKPLLQLCQDKLLHLCSIQHKFFHWLWNFCESVYFPCLEELLLRYLSRVLDNGLFGSKEMKISSSMVKKLLRSEFICCSEISLAEQILKWFVENRSVSKNDWDHSYSNCFFSDFPKSELEEILPFLRFGLLNKDHMQSIYKFLHLSSPCLRPIPFELVDSHLRFLNSHSEHENSLVQPNSLRSLQGLKCIVALSSCGSLESKRKYNINIISPNIILLPNIGTASEEVDLHSALLRKTVLSTKEHFTCSSKSRHMSSLPGLYEYGIINSANSLILAGGQTRFCEKSTHAVPWTWSIHIPSQSIVQLTNLKQARCLFPLVECCGCIYAIGGDCDDKILTSVERLSVSSLQEGWQTHSDLPVPLHEHAGCSSSTNLYVSGGYSDLPKDKAYQNDLWQLNVLSEGSRWRKLTAMNFRRSYHGMCCIDNSLFVVGGASWCSDSQTVQDVHAIESYCIATDQWSVVTSLPYPVSIIKPVVIGRQLLVMGGFSFTKRKWIFSTQQLHVDSLKWDKESLGDDYDSLLSYFCPVYMSVPFWLLQ